MMIAASTSRPTAIASPPRVIVFNPTSSGLSRRPARAIESGMVNVTTSAARMLPSNSRITSTTKTPPSMHRPAHASERRVHELRLVVDRAQLDALGQRAPNLLDGLTNPGRDLHRVGAELLDDPRADDFALQPMRDPSAHGGRLTNVGDVTKQHRHVSSNGDDRAPQVIDRCALGQAHARSIRSTLARRCRRRRSDSTLRRRASRHPG